MRKRGLNFIRMKPKKGAAEMDFLAYFVIAIIVLAIAIIAYFILSGKGSNAIEYIKTMFKNLFGG